MPASVSHSRVRMELYSASARRWIDFGVWDTSGEFAASRETAEHTPAGRPTEVYGVDGGLKVGEVTLTVAWRTGAFVRGLRFPQIYSSLVDHCNAGSTIRVWDQARNSGDDIGAPNARPVGYVGQIKKVSPHGGADSSAATPKFLTVTGHFSGVIAK